MSVRTRVNLLEAIERIAERAEESQLSNDFFDSVHKEMTYVSNVMDLHNYQVALLSVFINQCYDWRKRSIPTHLERHNPPTIIAKMGLKRA